MSTGLRGLKSGTDVRGRALGEDAPLTAAVAARIGGAFVAWLRQRGVDNPRVAVGRDSRVTGEMLLDACAEGCMKAGAQVETYGMCTTPAMYMSLITEGFGCDGSVMITASHHPYDRNGLKFFTKEGGIDSHDLDAILDIAESDAPLSGGSSPIVKRDFLPVYCEQLKDRVRKGLNTDVQKPLLGLHVVVDAGNGAGGFYAGLLEDLGAWVEGSQFLEPDGMFALISAILLDKKPGLTIVTDSVTSSGLAQFIMEWGGEHYRYKRGYRNVIDEAKRLNEAGLNCPLAIETSGHAALRENHFLDDGMYLVTVLICEAMRLKKEGRELTDLIADLREPVESAEIRLDITAEDFRNAGKIAIEKVMDHAAFAPGWHIAPDNREGVRINFDLNEGLMNGWFLLRLSVHDPVLPLNIESDVPGGVKFMAEALLNVLDGIEGIDLGKLKMFVEKEV